MFQSLIGRLRTDTLEFIRECQIEFQSLIGRLRTCGYRDLETLFYYGFNPL